LLVLIWLAGPVPCHVQVASERRIQVERNDEALRPLERKGEMGILVLSRMTASG
jgi:hypothetical protein